MLQKKTNELFLEAELALLDGRYAEARGLLDELGQRRDVKGELADCETYEQLSGRELHPEYRQLIQNRIDLVNSQAEYRRAS